MNFIRGNIPKLMFNEDSAEKVKLINLVIETCKRNEIGKVSLNQRIEYSEEEIKVIKKISNFVLWFYDNECHNFRTKKETEKLIKTLLNSIITEKPILFFALFCPSYKKGKEICGFNLKIGNTTRKGLNNLSVISRKAKSLNISCNVYAIYSDLVLENYKELKEKDFNDLESNFLEFKNYGGLIDDSIKFLKISEIGKCQKIIGYNGILEGDIFLDENIIKHIVNRSFVFYSEILGWNEKDIEKRTKDLIRSCGFMGDEITKLNSLRIMVMTENSYERGIFYYANDLANSLPIFYPKKVNSNIVEIK